MPEFVPPRLDQYEGQAAFVPPPLSSYAGQSDKPGQVSEFFTTLKDDASGLVHAVTSPIETIKGMFLQMRERRARAGEEFRKGEYGEAYKNLLAGVIPGLGEMAAQITEDVDAGNFGRASARIAELGLPKLLGKASKTGARYAPVARQGFREGMAAPQKMVTYRGISVDPYTAAGAGLGYSAGGATGAVLGGAAGSTVPGLVGAAKAIARERRLAAYREGVPPRSAPAWQTAAPIVAEEPIPVMPVEPVALPSGRVPGTGEPAPLPPVAVRPEPLWRRDWLVDGLRRQLAIARAAVEPEIPVTSPASLPSGRVPGSAARASEAPTVAAAVRPAIAAEAALLDEISMAAIRKPFAAATEQQQANFRASIQPQAPRQASPTAQPVAVAQPVSALAPEAPAVVAEPVAAPATLKPTVPAPLTRDQLLTLSPEEIAVKLGNELQANGYAEAPPVAEAPVNVPASVPKKDPVLRQNLIENVDRIEVLREIPKANYAELMTAAGGDESLVSAARASAARVYDSAFGTIKAKNLIAHLVDQGITGKEASKFSDAQWEKVGTEAGVRKPSTVTQEQVVTNMPDTLMSRDRRLAQGKIAPGPRLLSVQEVQELAEISGAGPSHDFMIATKDIGTRAGDLQFKRGMGRAGAGEGLSDLKTWDAGAAGTISVWVDPATKEVLVVNGHHRLATAKRLGVASVKARVIDAKTAGEAKLQGALENIRENNGSAIDAAFVFRENGISASELAEKYGISLKGEKAKQGAALAQLHPQIFDMVVFGELPVGRGSLIGELLPEQADQRAVVSLIDRSKKHVTDARFEELVRLQKGLKPEPIAGSEQINLFGDAEEMARPILERAEVSEYIRASLAKQKMIFSGVSDEAVARILGQEGNDIAVKNNAARAETLSQAQMLYDKLSLRGDVLKVLDDAAARMAKTKEDQHGEIKHAAYESIDRILKDTISRGTGRMFTSNP